MIIESVRVVGSLVEVIFKGAANASRAVVTVTSASCLLYTSDAADERSSVDLGGRRIIKKKTDRDIRVCRAIK